MEKELFNDLMESLNQAAEYIKGDSSKGRSVIVTIPDEETEQSQLLYHKITELPEASKQKAMQYIDELLKGEQNHDQRIV